MSVMTTPTAQLLQRLVADQTAGQLMRPDGSGFLPQWEQALQELAAVIALNEIEAMEEAARPPAEAATEPPAAPQLDVEAPASPAQPEGEAGSDADPPDGADPAAPAEEAAAPAG